MTFNKRKKNSRQRGSWTHGWGAKKKHRGAGNRGGRGMAGTGKRGDAKKPSIWKEKYFGKKGFKKKNKEKIVAKNIEALEKELNSLVQSRLVSKENDFYVVNAKKLKFNKLLGKGKTKIKFKISVDYASKKAAEIIKAAGGEIITKEKIVKKKEDKKEKAEKEKKVEKKEEEEASE
ncbi:uL15 family ribosomal protein [Candidatus Woesearchaeota archaeon]|nr:uL15 family ribosomal protein [Candidatus Woesearchaeota archaeon]